MYKRLSSGTSKSSLVDEGQMNTVTGGCRVGWSPSRCVKTTSTRFAAVMEGLISKRPIGGREGLRLPGRPRAERRFIPVPEEVEIVREIFERYVAGQSPRTIAHDLNRRRSRRHGGRQVERIDHQRLGQTRQRHPAQPALCRQVRLEQEPDGEDPDGPGKRVSTTQSCQTSGKSTELPELRIISDELFAARSGEEADCCSRRRQREAQAPEAASVRAAEVRSLWVGHDRRRARIRRAGPADRCSAHARAAPAPTRRRFYLDTVERTVLDHLRKSWRAPSVLLPMWRSSRPRRTGLPRRRSISAPGWSATSQSPSVRSTASSTAREGHRRERGRRNSSRQQGTRDARQGRARQAGAGRQRRSVLHPAAVKKFAEQIQLLQRPALAERSREARRGCDVPSVS